jgi:hypothetical protein
MERRSPFMRAWPGDVTVYSAKDQIWVDPKDYHPVPSWKCSCCGDSFPWFSREDLLPNCGRSIYSDKIHTDRGPFVVQIGGETYNACSFECHRDVWMAKTMEAVAKLIHETLKERK